MEALLKREGKDGNEPMRILILSTDAVFHQEIRALLENAPEITSIETRIGPQTMDQIQDLQPDLVLLDLEAATAYPLDLVSTISQRHPRIRIVVLSGPGQEGPVLDALRSGAHGHLGKGDNNREEFVAALQAVGRGDSFLSPAMAGVILDEISYRQQRFRHTHVAPSLQAPPPASASSREETV
jgi:DNA-binding NarL/FixJ family response regulator